MKKMTRLSKTTIFICIIAISFAILNGVFMSIMTAATQDIYERPYTVSNTARDIRSHLFDMKRLIGPVLTNSSANEEEFYTLFEERYSMQSSAITIIEERYSGPSEHIKSLRNTMNDLIVVQEEALRYASSGHTDEEILVHIEENVYPHYDNVNAALESIINFADGKIYNLTNISIQMSVVSIVTSCILTIAILFLSIHSNKVERRNIRALTNRERELEDSLLTVEAVNKTKKDFLSRMSHEMRTPLNSILGVTHLAKVKKAKGQDISEELELIEQSGEILLNLINDVSDVSRIESKEIEMHNQWYGPMETLQTAVKIVLPMMKEKNINFIYPKLDCTNEKFELYIDKQRISQVLINLLNNAAKFTPSGGTVSLSAKVLFHDDETSTDVITISDTGCGMSKEFISRIGEQFLQEQNEYSNQVIGSGLGLFIVKKIIDTMGGTLSVESELGKGSTFNIKLKYAYRLKQSTSKKEIVEKEINLTGLNVLCAEDIVLNQTILKHLLELKGINVSIVSDGLQALETFNNSEPGTFDAILMDIRMPVMSGTEATKTIRQLDRQDAKTIPIVAVSADATQEDVELAITYGFTGYLIKPIEPKKLYQILFDFCKKQ